MVNYHNTHVISYNGIELRYVIKRISEMLGYKTIQYRLFNYNNPEFRELIAMVHDGKPIVYNFRKKLISKTAELIRRLLEAKFPELDYGLLEKTKGRVLFSVSCGIDFDIPDDTHCISNAFRISRGSIPQKTLDDVIANLQMEIVEADHQAGF